MKASLFSSCDSIAPTEGMKVALEILAEESKFTAPDPLKYIDRSYLQQALKELGPG